MCAHRRREQLHSNAITGGKAYSVDIDAAELESQSYQREKLPLASRRHSYDEGDIFLTARSDILPAHQTSQPILNMAGAADKPARKEAKMERRKYSDEVALTFDGNGLDELWKLHNGGFNNSVLTGKNPSSSEHDSQTMDELADCVNREKRKRVRGYYRNQLNLVKNFREDKELIDKFTADESEAKRDPEEFVSPSEDFLAKITLAVNVCLLIAKSVAAALSGSLVVIGSVVDSATDITAGLVIHLTNRAIIKRDMYKYPRGRTRLQPIALVIISVIMGACSVQVISKSLESMARGNMRTDVELPTIIIMVSTIVVKFVLMIVCYLYRSPSTAILAQDHRNDTISNAVALVCAYLATKVCIYIDPIAAILVSVYILITWLRTGNEHVKLLSGRTAKPEFINRIVKICLDHRPALKQIDTVYAYHFGTKYLVEVDVVLDESLSLKEAHDIAEPLQRKIEHLPYVERAFVHIDYETEHRPEFEHKVV